jgi:hypothetical protein
MSGKMISITYSKLGTGSISEAIGQILRRIEHYHQAQSNPTGSCTRTPPGWAARSSGTERRRKLSRRGDCSFNERTLAATIVSSQNLFQNVL